MIQAFRDHARTPTLLHAVASSQGGNGGLKEHDGLFRRGTVVLFAQVSARESHRTPQSSEHSYTEKYRESCVDLINLA